MAPNESVSTESNGLARPHCWPGHPTAGRVAILQDRHLWAISMTKLILLALVCATAVGNLLISAIALVPAEVLARPISVTQAQDNCRGRWTKSPSNPNAIVCVWCEKLQRESLECHWIACDPTGCDQFDIAERKVAPASSAADCRLFQPAVPRSCRTDATCGDSAKLRDADYYPLIIGQPPSLSGRNASAAGMVARSL